MTDDQFKALMSQMRDQFETLMRDVRKIVYCLAAIIGLLIAIVWLYASR
jgi:hypothetical protein